MSVRDGLVKALLTTRVERDDRVLYGERWREVAIVGEPRKHSCDRSGEGTHSYHLVRVHVVGEDTPRRICASRLEDGARRELLGKAAPS